MPVQSTCQSGGCGQKDVGVIVDIVGLWAHSGKPLPRLGLSLFFRRGVVADYIYGACFFPAS